MAFNVLGLNHKTAPVALREKVAFNEDRLAAALRALRQETRRRRGGDSLDLQSHRSVLVGRRRARRNCRNGWSGTTATTWISPRACMCIRNGSPSNMPSASPRDSTPWCSAKPQILGQLKDAYRVAHETGSTGPWLNKLFQAAFSAAKRVRSETQIGANAVSLASAAVSLARRMYADLSAHTALMIGAGEMIALTARHFASAGVKRMVIANRTLARAQALAAEIKGYAVDLSASTRNWPRPTSS